MLCAFMTLDFQWFCYNHNMPIKCEKKKKKSIIIISTITKAIKPIEIE